VDDEEKPDKDTSTPTAAPAGDAYVRPPQPKKKKKKKSDKKMELDDLKREVEMVREALTRFHI